MKASADSSTNIMTTSKQRKSLKSVENEEQDSECYKYSDYQRNQNNYQFGFHYTSSQQHQKFGDRDSTLARPSIHELSLEEFMGNSEKRNIKSQLSMAHTHKSDIISPFILSPFMKTLYLKRSQANSTAKFKDAATGENGDRKDDEDVENFQISQNNICKSSFKSQRVDKVINSAKRNPNQQYAKQGEINNQNESGNNESEFKMHSSYSQQSRIWKRKWMQIVRIISKVRKLAIQCTLLFRPHMLNKAQVSLINDRGSSLQYASLHNQEKYDLGRQFSYSNFSHYVSFRNYRRIIKFILNNFNWVFSFISSLSSFYTSFLSAVLKHCPLFHYLSTLYFLWEAIIFTCSTALFIYIPYEYSFQISRGSLFQLYIENICPFIFGLDIFIRANTKSTQNMSFIENHIQIFNSYLKSGMIPDLVSLVSLNYQLLGFDGTYFLFFIRITKSFRILSLLREKYLLNLKVSGFISLLYLLGQVLYYIHLISCVWFAVGNYELQDNSNGWIVKYSIAQESNQIKYLSSFYYSVITITTIGYGDVTPQSYLEKLIAIFIALISSFVFGYSISSIENKLTFFVGKKGNILSDFKKKNDIYMQEVAKINKYFKDYHVDLELQARSRQYLDYIFSDNKEEMICSIDQLSSLSYYLQDEIKMNVFTKRLSQSSLFNDTFSQETLQQLALQLQEIIYSPNQNIIDYTGGNENMLYIVHSGTVVKYTFSPNNKNSREIQKIYEGQFFSLDKFFTGSQDTYYSYKSVGVSSILSIELNVFLDIIKRNEVEYEKFMYIRDQILYSQSYGAASLSCYSCQQKNHQLHECPYIFYSGRKARILRGYHKEIDDQIKKFKRPFRRLHFNSLVSRQRISEVIEKVLNNLSTIDNSLIIPPSAEEENQQISEEHKQLYPQKINEKITSYKEILSKMESIENEKTKNLKLTMFQNQSSLLNQNIKRISLVGVEDSYTHSPSDQTNFQTNHPKSDMTVLNKPINQSQSFQERIWQKPPSIEIISSMEPEQVESCIEFIHTLSTISMSQQYYIKYEIAEQNVPNKRFESHKDLQSFINGSKQLSVITKQIDTLNELSNMLKNQILNEVKNNRLSPNNNNNMSFCTQRNQIPSERSIQEKAKKKVQNPLDRAQSNNTANSTSERTLANNLVNKQNESPNIQENSKLFIYDFDSLKEYQYYFPLQNSEQIIYKVNQKYFKSAANIKAQLYKKLKNRPKLSIHGFKI